MPKHHDCRHLTPSNGRIRWRCSLVDFHGQVLLNMMHTYGYGNWERIRVEIRNAWQFNFDWFFKSRNASELGRRADLLIKLVEKENSDLDGRSRPKSSPRGVRDCQRNRRSRGRASARRRRPKTPTPSA